MSHFEPRDVAVVWDRRVRPEDGKSGAASMLFKRWVDWARGEGYSRLKLKMTSANVPMCLFCAKHEC